MRHVDNLRDAGITLLAMPRSGEILLVRDAAGTTWLIHPPGAGEPEIVTEDVVGEAVARHGWDRVDETFPSWAELDVARQRRVAETAPQGRVDVSRFDAEDVRRVVGIVSAWLRSGEVNRGRRALHRLLRDATIIRRDEQLFSAVTEMLTELDDVPPRPPLQFRSATVGDERRKTALRRMQLSSAA